VSELRLIPPPKIDPKKVYRVVQVYNISQTKIGLLYKSEKYPDGMSPQLVHNILTQPGYTSLLEKVTKSILKMTNKKFKTNFLIEQFYKD
jgi:hypothetical protein